jgi:hypothetical protein
MRITRLFIILIAMLCAVFPPPCAAQESRHVDLPGESAAGAVQPISREEAQREIEEAAVLFKAGREEAAIYRLQLLVQKDPTNQEALFKLGEMAIAAKNWAYSLEVLGKVAKLRPDDIEVRFILMDIFRAYQMPIQEIMAGEEIIRIDPDQAEALKRLAFLYQDQSLPREEERIRRSLARLEPLNYGNLARMRELLHKNGDFWEEGKTCEMILVRFPDKKEERAALNGIYEVSAERYRQLSVLTDILEDRSGDRRGYMRQYNKALKAYKKDELQYFNTFEAGGEVSRSSTRLDDLFESRASILYDYVFVRHRSDLQVGVQWRNIRYAPTQVVQGDRIASSYLFNAAWIGNWDNGQSVLNVGAGLEVTNVTGTTTLLPGQTGTVSEYPFLEARPYGGNSLVGNIDFIRAPKEGFGGSLYYHRALIEDIDAYVRLMARNTGGAALNYTWPDKTRLEVLYERGTSDDNNVRQRLFASGRYVLFATEPVHDRRGKRVGFTQDPPQSYLALGYTYETICDQFVSSFYESYAREYIGTGLVNGRLRIGRDLFLFGGASYGRGQALEYRSEYIVGLQLTDPDRRHDFILLYEHQQDKVTEGTQLNKALEGETKTDAVRLNYTVRF